MVVENKNTNLSLKSKNEKLNFFFNNRDLE